ncbi:hypothetical protein ACWEPC_35810, partial [Nonomuraea sp. NPDC004297]
KTVLLRRCLTWADEHGRPADDLLIAAAVDARHRSRDGRLAYWDESQIRRYLLAWIPKHVVAPREILEVAPEILRTYLGYLSAAGLRDPRGAGPAEADEIIARLSRDFRKALDDPYLQGLPKFWAQAALDHGNDLAGPGAVEAFRQDLDAGRIRYDQELLDQLLEARYTRTDLDLEEDRGFHPPPVALPPAADLAAEAARSRTVRRLVTLATWAGAAGRPLTEAGHLALPDARELSVLLGTGEERLDVPRSADLPQLSLLLAWATRLSLVRTGGRRLVQVAESAPLLRDPAALWSRAFEALPALGGTITMASPASVLGGVFGEVLPDVLNTLYGMDVVPVARLEETVWLACQEHAALEEEPPRLKDLWRRRAARDLERAFDVLADLGAVDLTRGPAGELYTGDLDRADQALPPDAVERLRERLADPDLLLARLTPPALHAVRRRLLAEGRDAPLIGELSACPAAELLGVLSQHYPPQEATAELNAWLARPGQDLEALLQAVRDCPFRTRAAAMLTVLAETLPEGQDLIRDLRRDPVLAPTALTFLVDEGEVDPGTLDGRERLLLGAENFLTLLELGGPQTLIDQLRAMAGRDAYEFAATILDSGHHDVVGLEEMRELVAEPLRVARPLRLIPGSGKGLGARQRRTPQSRPPAFGS